MQAGAGREAEGAGKARRRQVALEQRHPATLGEGRGGKAKRHLRLGRAGGHHGVGATQAAGQAGVGVELRPAQRAQPGGGAVGGGHFGHDRCFLATTQHHIRSGAEIPSRPSELAIVRMVSRDSAKRDSSTPSPSAPTTWQSR